MVGDHVSEDIAELIGYTSKEEDYAQYKLVIKPSEFFEDGIYGTQDSLPKLPLKLWEETPVLFGEPTEMVGIRLYYMQILFRRPTSSSQDMRNGAS